jgi:hypothetical protein
MEDFGEHFAIAMSSLPYKIKHPRAQQKYDWSKIGSRSLRQSPSLKQAAVGKGAFRWRFDGGVGGCCLKH